MNNTNLSGANLTGANLTGANLTGAETGINGGGDSPDWTGAIFNDTICGDGSNSDDNGGTCAGHEHISDRDSDR